MEDYYLNKTISRTMLSREMAFSFSIIFSDKDNIPHLIIYYNNEPTQDYGHRTGMDSIVYNIGS